MKHSLFLPMALIVAALSGCTKTIELPKLFDRPVIFRAEGGTQQVKATRDTWVIEKFYVNNHLIFPEDTNYVITYKEPGNIHSGIVDIRSSWFQITKKDSLTLEISTKARQDTAIRISRQIDLTLRENVYTENLNITQFSATDSQ